MDWELIAALTKADADLQETLADGTAGTVEGLYEGLDWYDHVAIGATAAVAGEVVRGAAQQSAGLTASYLTRVLREMTGPGSPTSRTLQVTGPLRMGVPSWGSVYGRVADTVRLQVAQGAPMRDAVRIGLERADLLARTDLLMARRVQSRATLENSPRVIGYRRVVHPELSRSGSCGLCIAAANRRYRKRDLMPMHRRCKCTVLPITASVDPGGSFDLDPAFEQAYDLSLSTSAADLKDVRVRYEWNDELGPTMSNAAHRSNNPGIRRAAREAREERARSGRPATSPRARASTTSAFDAMSRQQLDKQLAITEGLPDSQWRSDYLARLRARLAEIS